MPALDTVSAQLAPVLDWFEQEPADDPVEDLAHLRAHFVRLADPALPGELRLRCVEQFEGRIVDICERFKPGLLNTTLPLGREVHTATTELIGALLDVAGGFLGVLDAVRERWRSAARSESAALAGRALRLVNEAFVLGCMSGAMAPAGMWQRAYRLMAAAGIPDGEPQAPGEPAARGAGGNFKRLVALAVLQPESLTARELAWIFDYIESVATLGKLAGEPILPEPSAFWMDLATDDAPFATVRRPPPDRDGLLHFSARGMARRVGEQIEWLETHVEGVDGGGERAAALIEPDASGLPLGLTPLEALSLLRRVRDRWSTPPSRGIARRPHQYTVQVCAGLRAIWDMRRLGADAVKLAEWMVYNEGPGGYAIMSVSGVEGLLSAGMALALRRDAGQPWTICIVRWIRSDSPDQAELGLQVISQACTAVSIGFRGDDEVHATSPALILPPVTGLRGNPAILAPAGSYSSRRFMLVHEGVRLYVAQARVVSLDMQTASVELFQYEIDPYPI